MHDVKSGIFGHGWVFLTSYLRFEALSEDFQHIIVLVI